jgi:hypothetical protein
MLVERVASQNPARSKEEALSYPMPLNCFDGVIRTGRHKPAVIKRQYRRYRGLVCSYHEYQGGFHWGLRQLSAHVCKQADDQALDRVVG